MSPEEKIFGRFVPKAAVGYCLKLRDYYGFEFKIKPGRKTKLGDYRFCPFSSKHVITVNNDLNPYYFLFTYLHEVAHMATFEIYRRRAAPHGPEWKENFKKIAGPVLNQNVFPPDILGELLHYFKDPKAACCSAPALHNLLTKHDGPTDLVPLDSIPNGEIFLLDNAVYRKIEKKRTRDLCQALGTGKKYYIPEIAQVKKIG